MCISGSPIESIRIIRCVHGTFHVSMGRHTMRLDTAELLMLGQAINRWVQRHPAVLEELDEDQWDRSDSRRIG